MKIRIMQANTEWAYEARRPIGVSEAIQILMHNLPRRVSAYVEELQQQAKWDAEKCKS